MLISSGNIWFDSDELYYLHSMKRTILSFLLVITTLMPVKSQQHEFILPAMTKINRVPWRDSVYLFTGFHQGELIFDTGFESPQKHLLNYNLFMERMEEISSKGDTITLETTPIQHTIRIAGYAFCFFPNKGYMRVLEPGKVSLATWDYFNAGYLQVISSGYASRKNRVPLQVDNRKQPYEYDRSYILKHELYLIADNNFYHARKTNVLKLYEENKGVVEFYLDKHSVDFSNADSLIRVIRFLNDLADAPESKIPGMFRVKAGDPITRKWRDSLYLFPQFREADVKSSVNPKLAQSLSMNYNLSTGEMDYVTDSGDTLQFNSRDVALINFDDRSFSKQPGGGFAEVLIRGKDIFYELKRLKVVQEYRNPEVPKVYSTSPGVDEDTSGDRLCVIKSSYFFFSERNQFSWPANKGGFVRAFPRSRKKIDEYLSNHRVNFESRNDLIQLLSFCQQL